jgi:predicted SnoaL-like aldol condensation-catalyzing enzyme
MSDTEANKKAALELMDALFTPKGPEVAARILTPDYIQHNPNLPNGVEALGQLLGGFVAANPGISYEAKRAVADGDLVMIHGHLKLSAEDLGMAVVDIVRFEKGKGVEHWDITQPVPEQAANDNTMF